jgi:hypothetical protein
MPPTILPGNQFGPFFSFQKGSLISFQYLFQKHDPKPFVLFIRTYMDGRLAGLNLHYLTFPYVKRLISQYCGNQSLSYQAIKGDEFLVNAYRTYKRTGLRRVQLVDCEFLKTILESLRVLDPEEIEAMRKEVNKQLKEKLNQKAEELKRLQSTSENTNELSTNETPTEGEGEANS